MKSVFLLGIMGSGKTFWSNKLAPKLSLTPYDLDVLIEMFEEKSITEIFEEDGEEYFRKVEAKMLRSFEEKKQFILSCGGGTPCFHDNMKWMNENGVTVWLNVSVDVLFERLKKQKLQRPLIKSMSDDELQKYLHSTLKRRNPFYKQATYTFADAELKEDSFLKILKAHA